MSTPVKIILIVFGLLFVVVAASIGALIYFGHSILKEANDPAAQQRIAAKLGTFSIPAGYRIISALDFGGRQQVDIGPADRRTGFRIQLTGGALENGAAQEQGIETGLRLVGGLVKCDFKSQPDDVVEIAGKPRAFSVRACPDAPTPMRIESGSVSDDVTVTATGVHGEFDAAALHELLRSFK
jgi:hypothetical protein